MYPTKMSRSEVEYAGKDLESMEFAENYHRWILEIFKPFLGQSIVEVGAGTGSFSRLLLELEPAELTLVEPSAMYSALTKFAAGVDSRTKIRLEQDVFANVADQIRSDSRPDSIVYINVLEHIFDDEAELRSVHRTLEYGGHVCIFVPAIPFLLSDFDRQIGHYRRYQRRELIAKCEAAGFSVKLVRGFDLPGVLPWLIKYRLMRSTTMGGFAVRLYDKLAVPLIRVLENAVPPPIGKNLIIVGEKVRVKT